MDHKGFSLIEVIVAVAILAAISAPILQSFTTAAITNSRAQATQDATSLSEDIMEKVKSTSIETLYKEATGAVSGRVGDAAINPSDATFLSSGETSEGASFVNTAPYKISYNNVTATSGKRYDAEVTISTEEYSLNWDESAGQTELADASDANTFKAPDLKAVDSSKNLILSWEINSYDESAIDRILVENTLKMKTSEASPGDRSSVKSAAASAGIKNTRIVMEPDPADASSVKVDCFVSYEIDTSINPAYPNAVEYLVYTGTIADTSRPSDPNDADIYLFYSTIADSGCSDTFAKENILIEDKTADYLHDIYLLFQDQYDEFDPTKKVALKNVNISVVKGSEIFNNGSITGNIVPLDPSQPDKAKFYTNLAFAGKDGNLVHSKSKDRVYFVNVKVFKDGVQYAHLTSTMETGAETNH